MYVCIHILHICIYVIEMYTFRYVHRQTCMSLYQVVSRLFSGTEHCLQQPMFCPREESTYYLIIQQNEKSTQNTLK